MTKISFADYPEFTPNLTPRQMFQMGSFGGTYWRPIYSSLNKKNYKNVHLQYPSEWWKDIKNEYLTTEWDNYNTKINKYKVRVGSELEDWEKSGWINKLHPYGWVHWYCDFFSGKRSPDDSRQINRWLKFAGPNGRFTKRLANMIKDRNGKLDDYTISPKIRQTLQHWAYQITASDLK
jgi:hypothetical protein